MTVSCVFRRIKQIFIGASVSFTVIVIVLSFILAGLSGNQSIDPIRFLLIFPFSVCLSLANIYHKNEKHAAFLRFFVHSLLTVGGFFLFLYLPAYRNAETSSLFLVLLLFSVLYVIGYGIYALFIGRWKKQVRLESDYQPHFSSRKDGE